MNSETPPRLPEWIRPRLALSGTRRARTLLRQGGVLTVCEEARCPNRAECFSKPSAAFMILGPSCTRNCGFCSIENGNAGPVDKNEPARVAASARGMGLEFVVVTSVTRDDLPDGGAGQFALTVRALKRNGPGVRVEVLTPDFKGRTGPVDTVLESGPDVFNHNLETVPSLYSEVRPGADYGRSLRVLEHAKSGKSGLRTKSGLMLGLGESLKEVESVLMDLRTVGCDFVTIGQYLRPGRYNLPVCKYVAPEVFEELRETALGMGFRKVSSSPLTRSSMNAREMFS